MSLRLRVVLVLAGAVTLALGGAKTAVSAPTELFFSEYVEGTSNNKAVEIYNGTGQAVPLNGYGVATYSNGSTTASSTIALSGTLAAGDVYVVAHGSADPAVRDQADQTTGVGWFNGDDAVVLLRGNTPVDVIGQIGHRPVPEWGSGLTSTLDNTLRRKLTISAGDANGSDAFDPAVEWDGFETNTFGGLGQHGSTSAPTLSCPAISTLQGSAASGTVTSSDADGRVTSIEVTSVSPSPAPGTIARTAFTPAASTGGTATATISVSDNVPAGNYSVNITASNDDATPQTATCTQSVTVRPVLPIGAVQGSVSDSANGATHTTPMPNQTVTIRGVIYQKTLQRTNAGVRQYGFFIQNTMATADSDPNSSDGIFVFQNTFRDLIGGYVPQVGDEVVISGRVSEFFNLTQLSSARLEQLIRSNVPLDLELPAFEVNPADDLAAANRYWERREGMRALVPANTLSLDGRDVFPSTMDGEAWVMRGDHPLAQRSNPYARRSFRDPHPLDNNSSELFDDGNGYRILLSSLGLKAASDDANTLIAPTRTFDRIANSMVGGVYFGFNKYMVQVGTQPEIVHGVEPAENNPPTPANRRVEYSVADYNVENLYDFRDDPNDGCDFAGNPGCPGVRPPFDYVPPSDEVYQARLLDIARQIVNRLHAPDILMTQEGEDQDICTVQGTELSCGTADNADGKPDSLQELALAIKRVGGPAYDAAYDRDGADDRGIVSGFLYRTDRVELLPVTADDPLFGSSPQVQYRGAPLAYNNDVQNPKALNAVLPADVDRSSGTDGGDVYTRAPEVGSFRIWRNAVGRGGWVDIYAISNHFSSTPDARVGQRKEQSAYNAAIIDVLDNSRSRVVTGGDFNVFPRPDDPFAPGHPRYPSDQLGPLYEHGMTNLWDVAVEQDADSAYSYVFIGQVQTLDGQFVTPTLLDELVQGRVAHVNADYPADHLEDGPVGLSDHDPMVARFELAPTFARLAALLEYHRAAADRQAWNALSDRLARAKRFSDAGQRDAYRSQLAAFASQALDLAPEHLSQDAADALADEANLLRAHS